MFIGPCIIAIVDEWKTNLMSLAILFHLCWAHNKWNNIASSIKLVFHSSTMVNNIQLRSNVCLSLSPAEISHLPTWASFLLLSQKGKMTVVSTFLHINVLTMWRPAVPYTYQPLKLQEALRVATWRMYMFHMIITANISYFPAQHLPVGHAKGPELFYLWGMTPFLYLTLTLPTWRIWWAPNNASKWQMGHNSAFKVLMKWPPVFSTRGNCSCLVGSKTLI